MSTKVCHVPWWAVWITQDKDGRVFVWDSEPVCVGPCWIGKPRVNRRGMIPKTSIPGEHGSPRYVFVAWGRENLQWPEFIRELTDEERTREEVIVRVDSCIQAA